MWRRGGFAAVADLGPVVGFPAPERCPSGLRSTLGKRVYAKRTGGSNPPLSATVFHALGANPPLSAAHIYLVAMGMCASGSCAGVSELPPSAIAYFPMADDPNAADLELVRRIKQGEEEAFREMVERYHARVYSLSYGVLRNAEDAEEATQDTFLTLYRKIGTFDESKKFFSWFYRVALNSAYSRARRRKPAVSVSLEDYLPRFGGDEASPRVPGLGGRDRGRGDRPGAGGARRGVHRGASRRLSGRDLDGRRRGDAARRRRRDAGDLASRPQVAPPPGAALRAPAAGRGRLGAPAHGLGRAEGRA